MEKVTTASVVPSGPRWLSFADRDCRNRSKNPGLSVPVGPIVAFRKFSLTLVRERATNATDFDTHALRATVVRKEGYQRYNRCAK